MKTLSRIALVAWSCLLLLLSASAVRGENVGSVEVVKADLGRYRTLTANPNETAMRGFVSVVSPPEGKSFLVLWLDLKLTTGKDEAGDDGVTIEEEQIRLLDDAGKAFAPIGTCSREGMFWNYYDGYYYYGKPESATVPFDLVFAVPDDTQSFTLKFGSNESKIMAPAKAEEAIDVTNVAEFTIDKIEVKKELTWQEELGPYDEPEGEFDFKVRSTATEFVVVRVIVKPKVATSEYGFEFDSDHIGLLYGAQVYVPPIGYMDDFGDFGLGYTGFTSEKDAAGDFSAIGATLVFPLPGRITKFKMLYLNQPIGEGTIP